MMNQLEVACSRMIWKLEGGLRDSDPAENLLSLRARKETALLADLLGSVARRSTITRASLSHLRHLKTRTRKWHQRVRRKRSHLRTRGEVELFWMRARMSRWRMMMPCVLRSHLKSLRETKIMISSLILFSSRRI